MTPLDDFLNSLRKLGQKISREGRRTADMAKLKMDLKNLDYQRREVLNRLGVKVYDLNRRNVIKDENLHEQCVEQFDELDNLEMKIQKVLEDIHNLTLHHDDTVENAHANSDTIEMNMDEPAMKSQDDSSR